MRNFVLMGDSDNAWHNLAVEALLFEGLGAGDRVLYLWQNRNTVVIGRHQNAWPVAAAAAARCSTIWAI